MRNIELEQAIERADNFFGQWLFSAEIDSPFWSDAQDMASGDNRDFVKRLLGNIMLCELLRQRRRVVERAALHELDALYAELQRHVPSLGLESFRYPTSKWNSELNHAHDLGEWAYTFLSTAFHGGDPSPLALIANEAAERTAINQYGLEYDDPHAFQHRVAMVMMIDAALLDPDAVIRSLHWVREQLVKADPALEGK